MKSGCKDIEQLIDTAKYCANATGSDVCCNCPGDELCYLYTANQHAGISSFFECVMYDLAVLLERKQKFAMPNALYVRLMRHLSDDGSPEARELLGWIKRLKKESEKDE